MRNHSCPRPRETLLWLVPDIVADLGVILYDPLLFIQWHHFKILHTVFPHNIVIINHHLNDMKIKPINIYVAVPSVTPLWYKIETIFQFLKNVC